MLKQSLKVASTFMATTLALAIFAPHAKAFNFTFSFDNVTGNVTGTVSGTITGLEDNTSNQAADSVIIESFPVGLEGSFDEGNDAVAWSIPFANSFTVTSGSITDANFSIFSVGGNDRLLINFSGTGGTNLFSKDNLATNVANQDGFGGVTFAPATPVPFGVIPDTGLGILAGIWVISRLRRNIVARKPFK